MDIYLGGKPYDLSGIEVVQDPLLPASGFFSPRSGNTYRGIILHHDACLSAAQCAAVCRNARDRALRGEKVMRVSTHFVIDNDGAVVQFADPLLWRAWSAGDHDRGRIAIDISNACELQFASRYRPPRQVVAQRIHGAQIRWLAPYPVQVESLVALVRLLCQVAGVPARVPLTADGEADLRLLDPAATGVVGHLHLARTKAGKPAKCDPFGLDWPAFQKAISG